MDRRWAFFGGTGLLLLGYFLGQSGGPASIEFPDPDVARDATTMEQAVETALMEPRAFPRASALIRLFEGLSPANVEGASQAIAARAGGWDPVDLQLFLTAWVHLDPLSAVRSVEAWPIKSRREIGLKIAIREWAASGGHLEAVNYVQSMKSPQARAMAAGPLVRGWALGGDSAGALVLSHRLWQSGEKLDVVDGLVRGVLQVKGASGALEMMRSVDPVGAGAGEFEHRLVRVTLNLAGREDPPAAAEAYSEVVGTAPAPEWLEGSLDRLAGLWRNEDPPRALEWVLPHAVSAERKKAMTETVGTWANRDFEAAWKWFEEERGPFAEGADLSDDDSALLIGLIRRMARTDPPRAAMWARRINEEAARKGMTTRTARFWARENETAAREWIDSLKIDAAETRRLQEVVDQAAARAEGAEHEISEARRARFDDGH